MGEFIPGPVKDDLLARTVDFVGDGIVTSTFVEAGVQPGPEANQLGDLPLAGSSHQGGADPADP